MRLVGASHFHHTKNHTFMQLFHFVTSHLKKQQWKHKCSIFFNKQPVQSQFWSSSLSELIKYKLSVKLQSSVQRGLLLIFYIYLSLLLTVMHVSERELLNWNALSIWPSKTKVFRRHWKGRFFCFVNFIEKSWLNFIASKL